MATNLTSDATFDRVAAAAAAGTSTITTDTVDLKEHDGVTFAVLLGDVSDTSVITATIQHGDESDDSDMADTGVTSTFTAGASDADNNVLLVEAVRPLKRYCRVTVDRATANAAIDGVLAILTDPTEAPVTQSDDVLDTGFAASPASA
jgi:hypothetical protein